MGRLECHEVGVVCLYVSVFWLLSLSLSISCLCPPTFLVSFPRNSLTPLSLCLHSFCPPLSLSLSLYIYMLLFSLSQSISPLSFSPSFSLCLSLGLCSPFSLLLWASLCAPMQRKTGNNRRGDGRGVSNLQDHMCIAFDPALASLSGRQMCTESKEIRAENVP